MPKLGGCRSADEDAGKKPETPCVGSGCPTPPKPVCPDGCGKVPNIKAKQASYTVVINKSGNEWAGYPILEFEISDGCPNHYIDIQVAKKTAGLLVGGPGIGGGWDKTKLPKDRITQNAFSSWTNGETSIKLDGSGKATYKMPLDWWKDLARQPRSIFTTMQIHFRVLAFCDPKTSPVNSAVSHIDVINNLVDFKVTDKGYSGDVKNVDIDFTVKEENTTEMFTIVQWKIGSNPVWGGSKSFETVKDYDLIHESNMPEWSVDRVHKNPRYWDGVYTISSGNKKATATDAPGGPIAASNTHDFLTREFDARIHLDCDVPASVTIKRKEGSPPVFGIVIGIIAPPEPLILDSNNWSVRILQVKNAAGSPTITHPNTFAGPAGP